MSKRRSLDDALITPEEQALLSTGIAATENPTTNEPAKTETAPLPPQPQPEAVKTEIPAKVIQTPADNTLTALTTLVSPRIKTALFRASMERKIQRIEPFTQQDIVSEALAAWLTANGYA